MAAEKFGDMNDSPYSYTSGHSRESSGASDNYSPSTQTFSFHEQSRFTSSSSLATTPPKFEPTSDSPTRVSKTALHDLVEDPAEREEEYDLCDLTRIQSCQCDAQFCVRQCMSTDGLDCLDMEYSLADDFNSDSEARLYMPKKRQEFSESPVSNLASRIGSRLPSLRRLRDKTPTSPSVGRQGVRSAPTSRAPSRTSSFRIPSLVKPSVTHLETHDSDIVAPPELPISLLVEDLAESSSQPQSILLPPVQDPIDRKALASTPLLPQPLSEGRISEDDSTKSPLQSPTIVDSPQPFLFPTSPILSPVPAAMPTPPLSSKASFSSFGMSRSTMGIPMTPADYNIPVHDEWTAKLGHADFHIFPQPYVPDVCSKSAGKQFTDDWESARKQFMSQAARTSEHYGPTSQTFKLTGQKWNEIDAQWRRNHAIVVSRAKTDGGSPKLQALADTVPLAKLPSLNHPSSNGKFPKLDDADIVGPMVQYEKPAPKPSKKSAFMKFFSDLRSPSNTIGRKSPPKFDL